MPEEPITQQSESPQINEYIDDFQTQLANAATDELLVFINQNVRSILTTPLANILRNFGKTSIEATSILFLEMATASGMDLSDSIQRKSWAAHLGKMAAYYVTEVLSDKMGHGKLQNFLHKYNDFMVSIIENSTPPKKAFVSYWKTFNTELLSEMGSNALFLASNPFQLSGWLEEIKSLDQDNSGTLLLHLKRALIQRYNADSYTVDLGVSLEIGSGTILIQTTMLYYTMLIQKNNSIELSESQINRIAGLSKITAGLVRLYNDVGSSLLEHDDPDIFTDEILSKTTSQDIRTGLAKLEVSDNLRLKQLIKDSKDGEVNILLDVFVNRTRVHTTNPIDELLGVVTELLNIEKNLTTILQIELDKMRMEGNLAIADMIESVVRTHRIIYGENKGEYYVSPKEIRDVFKQD